METDDEFEKAVKKVLWAVGLLPDREQRVLALKAAVTRLGTLPANRPADAA
jgi:hypothetical protein